MNNDELKKGDIVAIKSINGGVTGIVEYIKPLYHGGFEAKVIQDIWGFNVGSVHDTFVHPSGNRWFKHNGYNTKLWEVLYG